MELGDLGVGNGLHLTPRNDAQACLANMRINLERELPEVKMCRPHSHKMSIAAGGPSLSDTKDDLDGYICAVNGSLKYLLNEGIKVDACVIVDPDEVVGELIIVNPQIHYYIASIAHPKVFEKLKDCHVVMWHPSGPPGAEELMKGDWLMIGGGSTVGLRSINLGYVCGFRKFEIHGLDSSLKDNENHAYFQSEERKNKMTINGRETYPDWLEQIKDFSHLLDRFSQVDADKVEINLHGDGLLQDWYKFQTGEKSWQ